MAVEIIDQRRASRVAFIENRSAPTAAFEPLVLDLQNGPRNNRHWVILSLSASGTMTVNPLVPGAGIVQSGLYLVRQADPTETTADAAGTGNPVARGHRLHCEWYVESISATLFTFTVHAVQMPLVVPADATIRLIVVPNSGNAAPGPGAGSVAQLTALLVDEENVR